MTTNHYDQNYFSERDILIPHLAKTIENLMKRNNLKSVLDVGCGTGRLVKFLKDKGYQASGCDNSKEAIKYAHKLKNTSVILGSATKIPFKDGSFDLVCAISLVEHLKLKEAKEFLSEASRVLKPKGFLFLVTPNFASPLRLLQGPKWFGYQDPTHITFYTPKSLKKLIAGNGFGNHHTTFKINFQKSIDWEFPLFAKRLPKPIKIFALFLLFGTPLATIRNSIWVAAQKNLRWQKD